MLRHYIENNVGTNLRNSNTPQKMYIYITLMETIARMITISFIYYDGCAQNMDIYYYDPIMHNVRLLTIKPKSTLIVIYMPAFIANIRMCVKNL